jgi:hypothetical protein
MEERSSPETGPEEPDAVDAESLPREAFRGDVLTPQGEVIDTVDGIEFRNIVVVGPEIPQVEPTREADFTKDFPEVADVG